MSEYMYLFRRGEIPEAQRSPEKMQAHMQRWLDWIQSLSQQGTFIAGQPLQNEGQVVAGSAKVITDGPFAEGKEIVGGYLIVRASGTTLGAHGGPLYPGISRGQKTHAASRS